MEVLCTKIKLDEGVYTENQKADFGGDHPLVCWWSMGEKTLEHLDPETGKTKKGNLLSKLIFPKNSNSSSKTESSSMSATRTSSSSSTTYAKSKADIYTFFQNLASARKKGKNKNP